MGGGVLAYKHYRESGEFMNPFERNTTDWIEYEKVVDSVKRFEDEHGAKNEYL